MSLTSRGCAGRICGLPIWAFEPVLLFRFFFHPACGLQDRGLRVLFGVFVQPLENGFAVLR